MCSKERIEQQAIPKTYISGLIFSEFGVLEMDVVRESIIEEVIVYLKEVGPIVRERSWLSWITTIL